MIRRQPKLADTQAIAHMLDLAPATVRWYAHKGAFTPRGKDGRRTLYDIHEVELFMKRRNAALTCNDAA